MSQQKIKVQINRNILETNPVGAEATPLRHEYTYEGKVYVVNGTEQITVPLYVATAWVAADTDVEKVGAIF